MAVPTPEFESVVSKVVAFDGNAGKGAVGNITLFYVTGDVLCRVFGMVSETLVSAGGGTLTVGSAGNTAGILSSIAASALLNNDIFVSGSSPAEVATIANSYTAVNNGADITATIATAAVTDGTITFYCVWRPLSVGASVVAA